MWARWVSTVRVERKSWSAISLLVWPSAIRRSTSSSRSLRSSGGPAGSIGGRGHARSEPGIEVGVAGGGEPDRFQQFLVGGFFEHEAERSGLQRLACEGGVVLHREDDDGGLGRLLAQARDRLQARAAGHVEVQDQDRGAVGAGEAFGVGDGAGFGDDLEAVFVVDQQPQALAHDGVVVGDDHGGLVAVGSFGAHGGSLPRGRGARHDRAARRSSRPPVAGVPDASGGGYAAHPREVIERRVGINGDVTARPEERVSSGRAMIAKSRVTRTRERWYGGRSVEALDQDLGGSPRPREP